MVTPPPSYTSSNFVGGGGGVMSPFICYKLYYKFTWSPWKHSKNQMLSWTFSDEAVTLLKPLVKAVQGDFISFFSCTIQKCKGPMKSYFQYLICAIFFIYNIYIKMFSSISTNKGEVIQTWRLALVSTQNMIILVLTLVMEH